MAYDGVIVHGEDKRFLKRKTKKETMHREGGKTLDHIVRLSNAFPVGQLPVVFPPRAVALEEVELMVMVVVAGEEAAMEA